MGSGGNDDDGADHDDDGPQRPTTTSILQIKILMQRAGYFTKTLLNQFKCLNEEERKRDNEQLQRHHRRNSNIENGNGNGNGIGADDLGVHRSSGSRSYAPTDDDDNYNN